MGQHCTDVLRDEYDFSDREVGRHHAAYRRRKAQSKEPRGGQVVIARGSHEQRGYGGSLKQLE